MESPESPTQVNNANLQAQLQARLRRERREAKIKAGASARLEKITNLSGRQNLPESPPASFAPSTHNDPDEVDLSTHPSAARTSDTNSGAPSEVDLRALLHGSSPPSDVDKQPQQPQDEDSTRRMLQQLMGGLPSAGGQDGGGDGGLPPGLAAILGLTGPPEGQENNYGRLWKVLHAIFALCLGIYVTATTHVFCGDISPARSGGVGHESGMSVFWVFTTAELMLQSSSFFLQKGRASSLGGWIGIVGNMLPEPWRSWLRLVGRYTDIWSTVVEDGMVVVFVVGCVAWWKGAIR